MSVVVAIKHEGKIFIGSDSQVTKGGTRQTLNNPNNYKIWKVKGVDSCLMAHVGCVRDANVIRIMNNLVDELTILRDEINFEYVVREIVPNILNELRKYHYLGESSSQAFELMDSDFLFAYKDRLFLINQDGCVIEIDDSIAIGSGSHEAIGSILSTDSASPNERIIKAITASAVADIYVDYPIILSDTETTEFTVVNEKNEHEFLKGEK